MDNQDNTSEQLTDISTSLEISTSSHEYLIETGKWTKFLSIVGFIMIGIIVLLGIFSGTLMSSMSGGATGNIPAGMGILFSLAYVGMGILYFFPAMYLFNFSNKLSQALSLSDSNLLTEALKNQKSFYKFWGIAFVVILGIYLVIGLIALTSSIF